MSEEQLAEEVAEYCQKLGHLIPTDMFAYCSSAGQVESMFKGEYSDKGEAYPPQNLPYGRLELTDPFVCGCYYPQWVYNSYVDELVERGSKFDRKYFYDKLSTVKGRQCLFPPCANSICQPSRLPRASSGDVPRNAIGKPTNEAGPCPDLNVGECFQTVQMTGGESAPVTWQDSPTEVSHGCTINFGELETGSSGSQGAEVGGQGTPPLQTAPGQPWQGSVKTSSIWMGSITLFIVILSVAILWWGFN